MAELHIEDGETIADNFDNLPSGWYPAQIIESSVETKENGIRLNLTFEVMDGQFAKRRIWTSPWAKHSNAQADEIGQKLIRTIGAAVGVLPVRNDEDLRFKPMEIRVGLNKKQEGYEQRNEVKSARKFGSAATPSAPVAGGAPASTPWGKKAA